MGVCTADLRRSLIGQLSVPHVLIIKIENASHADKKPSDTPGWRNERYIKDHNHQQNTQVLRLVL